MSLFLASFKGVKLHVDSACQKLEFRHQSYEFISKHEPTTELFAKAPNEYTLEGFIIGKDALLTKDLLYTACAEASPGVLFHPLLGYKRAVCVSLKIEEILECSSAYSFSMQCKEVSADTDTGMVDQALSMVEKAHELINRYALLLNQELAILTKTAFGIKRAIDALVKIDSVLTSHNGIGLFSKTLGQIDSAFRQAKELITSPHGTTKLLCGALAGRKSRAALLTHLQPDSVVSRGTLVFSLLYNLGEETHEAQASTVAKSLLNDISDPEIFAALWDISLGTASPLNLEYFPSDERMPSLVASFKRFGNLDHSEVLARAAKQPFAV